MPESIITLPYIVDKVWYRKGFDETILIACLNSVGELLLLSYFIIFSVGKVYN